MLEHHQVRGVSMLELSRTVRPEFGGRIPLRANLVPESRCLETISLLRLAEIQT